MAEKKKSQSRSKPATTAKTNVTRITAADARTATPAKTKTTPKKKPAAAPKKAPQTTKSPSKSPAAPAKKTGRTSNPFRYIIDYVKGAWVELRQVRWPNRRTTWSLSLAVILFTAFFVALIILLDYGFQWVFEQVLLG